MLVVVVVRLVVAAAKMALGLYLPALSCQHISMFKSLLGMNWNSQKIKIASEKW